MDVDAMITVGVLGFGLLNAVALASVLVLTRPGRRRVVEMASWGPRTAPEPYVKVGQPVPAELAA